jgi:glycosyltransferase involved in cell wall biosynthesis
VAGEGPERAALEAEARALGVGDRVSFLGFRPDTPSLLASADLFVLPSLIEGLPLSVLEAMAAGCPVVATAAGGTGEIVQDRVTGLLVPPADAEALAAAMQELLRDRPLAARLAGAGRDRVRREFSAAATARSVMSVYDELLERRCVPAGGRA